MADITFTIPNDKLSRVVDAMKGLYPIPMIPNPAFDPEQEVGPTNQPEIPEFTDNQWAKEAVRRFIRRTVGRYEQKVSIDAVQYTEDDTIAT